MTETNTPNAQELREMNTEEIYSVLRFVANISQSSEEKRADVALSLFFLYNVKAHEKLGYNSFFSMLAENNVTYSRRTINMLVRAGWTMAVAKNEGFETDFSGYSVAKLEMVATPVEQLLHGGQPDEAKRFLLMAREIDRGGVSRSDIRKAMIEAGLTQPKPKRYIVYIYGAGRTELAFVKTAEDPTTAPPYVRAIVEVKKIHRAWEMHTYKSFACKE